jgi:hypothetical protein
MILAMCMVNIIEAKHDVAMMALKPDSRES